MHLLKNMEHNIEEKKHKTHMDFCKSCDSHDFTLTDHFKRYKMKEKTVPEDFDSLYAES